LTLVVLVLLVMVAATKVMVTGEFSSRRNERARLRTETLLAALDQVRRAGVGAGESIRLPIDSSADQWVIVSVDQDSISAQWHSGDRVQQTAVRRLSPRNPSAAQN
jgi:hypothetical protein